MRPRALFIFLLLSTISALVSEANADSVFHYLSESGDFIGGGVQRTATSAGGFSFKSTSSASSVTFNINNANYSETFELNFTAPLFAQLAVGRYFGAIFPAFLTGTHPGLTFEADGRDSSTIDGEFIIREITFSAPGQLATFAADFVQHAAVGSPASFGEIRYNSAIPYLTGSGAAELGTDAYALLETAGSLTVNVQRLEGCR